MKILHIIIGLHKGGAEGNLYQFISRTDIPKSDFTVVSLIGKGYYSDLIEDLGATVYNLSITKRPLYTFCKLVSLCKQNDIISCWMYHANLIGYYATRFCKMTGKKLIWNVRNGRLNPKYDSKPTIRISKKCAKISHKIDCIAYNGSNSKLVHEDEGYCDKHSVILNNACDFEYYKPRPEVKEEMQKKVFGFENTLPVIISVARFHPAKDHNNLFDALIILKQRGLKFRLIMCGGDINEDNESLVELCKSKGFLIGEDVFLLGVRDDVNLLLNCSDLYILHSAAAEAFPNALAQSMASGCLAIGTDVGCAREIMSNDRFIINSENSLLLADKAEEVLNLDKDEVEAITKQNRQRIIDNYSIEKVISRYEEVYK